MKICDASRLLRGIAKNFILSKEQRDAPNNAADVIVLLGGFPEINLNNYDASDVAELNAWGVQLVSIFEPSIEVEYE